MSDDPRAEYTRKLNEGISWFLERLEPPEGLEVKHRRPETAEFFAFNPHLQDADAEGGVIFPLRRMVIAPSLDGGMSFYFCKEGEPCLMLHVRDDYEQTPMPYLPLLLAQTLTAIAEFYLWVAQRSKILIVSTPFVVKSETYFDSMKTLYRCSGRYGWEESDE